MTKQEPEIYTATAKRILKKTDKRAGREAVQQLRQTINEYGEKLSQKAAEMAEHADRKTIRKKDLQIAEENL